MIIVWHIKSLCASYICEDAELVLKVDTPDIVTSIYGVLSFKKTEHA